MKWLAPWTALAILLCNAAYGADAAILLQMLQRDLDWSRTGCQPGQADTLLEYYRGCEGVNFYFNRGDIPAIVQAIRREAPGEIEAAIAAADEILAHRFQNSTSPTIVNRVQLPDEIDWDNNPTEDPEFVHMLARSRFWQELGLAYMYTGDEKYAAEFARQMDSWIVQAPLPGVREGEPINPWWRTINTGIRMDTWMWVYQAFLHSEHMTPGLHARILGILGEHGRVLREHHSAPTTNWCAMEMQGLLNLALMFPEFKQSAEWRDYAVARLVEAIKTQVRPDGVQVEQSPSYHNGCIRWFYEPMRLAQRNGVAFPPEYRDTLRKMAEFTLWTIGPDGRTVALSDSDRDEGGKSVLASMAIEFNEPTFAYLAAPSARHYWVHGADVGARLKAIEPRAPEELMKIFPNAGYLIMRTDWMPGASYCIFDCGPRGGGHGHFDLLSMEIYAYGKLLIADPGRWLYADVPLRHEVMSTPAHNTVSINGANHEAVEVNAEELYTLLPHRNFTGSHRAYRLESGRASVKRQVVASHHALTSRSAHSYIVVDEVDAPEPVTAQVNWQFATTAVERLAANVLVVGPPGEPRAIVAFAELPEQQVQVEDSVISRVYGSKEEAKRLRLTRRGQKLLFVTVIKALEPGAPSDDPPQITLHKKEDGTDWIDVLEGRLGYGLSVPVERSLN
jgi:hypothetical protein